MEIEKVSCLVCDKELKYELCSSHGGNVMDGGFMLISFHYGSKHDQCHGMAGRKRRSVSALFKEKGLSPMEKMLDCDEIEAFICDQCFEKKFSKMRGYDVFRKETRSLIANGDQNHGSSPHQCQGKDAE